MQSRYRCGLALLALAVAAGLADAQQAVVLPPSGGAPGTFSLVPEAVPGASQTALFAPVGAPDPQVTVLGTANGLAFTSGSGIAIGFDYVRPLWSFRDFTLAVPGGSGGNFPILG